MKILVLSPHWSTDSSLVKGLQGYGIHALVASDSQEAWQVLKFHSSSIELVVAHREENASKSLEFVKRYKADSQYRDLPYLMISSEWGPTEFAAHQSTAEGANAYLKWPCALDELVSTMGAVVGREFVSTAPKAPSPRVPAQQSAFDVKVEAVADVFAASSASVPSQIHLDAPTRDASDSTQATIQVGGLSSSSDPHSGVSTAATIVPPPFSASLPIDLPPPVEQSAPLDLNPSIQLPEPVMSAQHSEPPAPPAIEEVEFISTPPNDSSSQLESEQEMPYLFGKNKSRSAQPQFEHPVGDAVVPGGAAQSPDVDTLKKYLLLREQDVAALSGQLKAARAENAQTSELLKQEKARVAELEHLLSERQRDAERFEREKQLLVDAHRSEVAEVKFQAQAKTDRVRALELEVREAGNELERIKDRVRSDLRKIRTRERDLETKLELSRKDAETLVAARESKIIELKRKVDLLEFNLDVIQSQLSKERESSAQLKERLLRAKQAVKAAGGLLATDVGAEEAS